ncbi:MAG: DUF4159 domain-containing protein [Planctomycetes bacterium]|nr:DUF4159 domain-containing protein [Planctomycetota bacterium]
MRRSRLTPLRAALLTAFYVGVWRALVSFLPGVPLVALAGWVIVYVVGLMWAIYLFDRATKRYEARVAVVDGYTRPQVPVSGETVGVRRGGWNPFDVTAAYYGPQPGLALFLFGGLLFAAALGTNYPNAPADIARVNKLIGPFMFPALVLATAGLATAAARSQRVRQSLSMVAVYSLLFGLLYVLMHLESRASGEQEYDLPPGGGNDSPQAMSVKVQKVIRKKFVINPYSNVSFAAPPPIDSIDVKLNEETANRYQVGMGDGGLGQGDGDGGGFGSGKDGGKIRFIRLRHSDKSWDKNFGIGGDKNLLTELVVRFPKMNGKVAEETESMDVATLGTFKQKASPPLVYIGGAGTFAPSAADKRVLKAYITERHGMILGDTLGNGGFHGNFIAAMNEITGTTAVTIPRDDLIHRRPFDIPQLPIVVAHGGTSPLGWKIDGRWAVYYHPGALSDAWRDDRAGIKKAIADQCYLLGINIIYYAHREHNEWRRSQQP